MTTSKIAIVNYQGRSRLLQALLGLILALPLIASFFTDHEERREWENRVLADTETISSATSAAELFPALESYLEDHMGFALTLNKSYRRLKYYVFRDSPVANISLGPDGFVFLTSYFPNSNMTVLHKICGPNPDLTAEAVVLVTRISTAMVDYDVNVTFAIVPSKPLLYADKLPASVPAELRESCLNTKPEDTVAGHVLADSHDKLHKVYYPMEQLLEKRNEPEFYPPGNFHPNSKLNHVFARGLLTQLGLEPRADFGSSGKLQTIRADLPAIGFNRDALAWQYTYPEYGVVSARHYPKWIKKHNPKAQDYGNFATQNPMSQAKVLILSNSFGAFIAPHLAPGFRSIIQVNTNNLKKQETLPFFEQAMNQIQPDEVIFLLHDSALPNFFLRTLADALDP